MDSDISTLVKEKKRRFNLRLLFAALIVLAAGAWGLRQVLGASVRASEIRIAAVENGPVENTLTATGLVAPEFEQLISSPLHAVIQSVSLSEGAPLKVGDLILTLDKETAGNDFEKQRNQLLLKQNAIERLRLDLEKSYFDLKINDSIKQYRIEAIRADLENAKRLFRAGGGTRESIEKIENDLKIARLEKDNWKTICPPGKPL
jgi:HlyD family secretion protein